MQPSPADLRRIEQNFVHRHPSEIGLASVILEQKPWVEPDLRAGLTCAEFRFHQTDLLPSAMIAFFLEVLD